MCNIETWAYPTWWDAANTIAVNGNGLSITANRADTQFLPQGIAAVDVNGGVFLLPWAQIKWIQRTS